jgi:putative transposase
MAKRDFNAKDSIRSLKRKIKLKEYSDIRDRIRVIVMVLKGKTDLQISAKLDYSIQWVKKWVGRYKKDGLDGLYDQSRSGQPTKLTSDQIIDLDSEILSGPDADNILARYRVSDIQELVKKKWNVEYSPSGMLALMKRMKLSHVTPRPQHPENDEKVMTDWKKNSKSSLKNKNSNIQKKTYSFGSKMNQDSGKKVL